MGTRAAWAHRRPVMFIVTWMRNTVGSEITCNEHCNLTSKFSSYIYVSLIYMHLYFTFNINLIKICVCLLEYFKCYTKSKAQLKVTLDWTLKTAYSIYVIRSVLYLRYWTWSSSGYGSILHSLKLCGYSIFKKCIIIEHYYIKDTKLFVFFFHFVTTAMTCNLKPRRN